MRPEQRRILVQFGVSAALWVGLTIAFAFWIDYEVREEFRLGYRTDTGRDNIVIPIFGFARLLAEVLIVGNLLILVIRQLRRPARPAI